MSGRSVRDIPTWELTKDYFESLADIAVCEEALRQGIEQTSDGTRVQTRLEVNQEIIKIASAELWRRGALPNGN